MQTENSSIETLFSKYLDGSITREEFNEFFQLLKDHDKDALTPQLQKLWLQTEGVAPVYTDEEWNNKLRALIEKAEQEDAVRHHGVSQSGPRVIRMYWKWIAAASIILLVGLTTYVILSTGRRPATEGHEGRHKEQPVAQTHDVPAPSNTRAVITLANGQKVYLDSLSKGTIAQENNVNVVKNENGEVVYNAKNAVTLSGVEARTAYNTLYNPRGSKVISLTLSDGTKVWLNSESSLRYPASFASNAVNREVEITGEAYFEVKHNTKQPFKVHLPNGSILEDIGTSFNINAYPDESDIKTTLIEGSVRVMLSGVETSTRKGIVLRPGEQAIVSPSTPLRVTNSANLTQVIAWRENKFFFDGADIHTIARQLSRWYDVEVEIKDNIPSHFTGIINRDVPVSQVFDMLQKTGAVHFSVEGKKIIVMK